MSVSFNLGRIAVLSRIVPFIALFLLVPGTALGVDGPGKQAALRIVALDPGHGGHDTGARGPDNLLEKHVAMKFSRILAEQLKSNFKVLLTRTDDYDVPFEDRIAKSNHAHAELFISIHAGGSLLHNRSGLGIFYYEKAPVMEFSRETAPVASIAGDQLAFWDTIKPEHIESSKYLAELLKARLLEDQKNLKLAVMGMPLFVAAGTDMPTLLIEIGYVTNPGDARMLSDTEMLIGYARSILKAVNDFFSDKLRL